MNVKDSEIHGILDHYRKITVYGLSNDPDKPSHSVPLAMKQKGWDVVGTYPRIHSVGGFQIYKTLAEVPLAYRKFVDVFRASARIPDVVDEVLEVGGVEVLFLQLGIEHPAAEERAEKAGIRVISNRCLWIEYKKHFS